MKLFRISRTRGFVLPIAVIFLLFTITAIQFAATEQVQQQRLLQMNQYAATIGFWQHALHIYRKKYGVWPTDLLELRNHLGIQTQPDANLTGSISGPFFQLQIEQVAKELSPWFKQLWGKFVKHFHDGHVEIVISPQLTTEFTDHYIARSGLLPTPSQTALSLTEHKLVQVGALTAELVQIEHLKSGLNSSARLESTSALIAELELETITIEQTTLRNLIDQAQHLYLLLSNCMASKCGAAAS